MEHLACMIGSMIFVGTGFGPVAYSPCRGGGLASAAILGMLEYLAFFLIYISLRFSLFVW